MICSVCKIDKEHTIKNFSKSGNGKLRKLCKTCKNAADRIKYNASPVEKRRKNKEYSLKLRKQVIDAYGGMCIVCKNDKLEELELDHIFGNGYEHRKNGIKALGLYRYAVNNDYPDDLQVLCWRCNMAKGQGSTEELISWILHTAAVITNLNKNITNTLLTE